MKAKIMTTAVAEGLEKNKKEYETMTVESGQAIALTTELPHGGGENETNKVVYCLFLTL
jgi:hypothetical protein